jgi:hypothetical protein
MAIQKTITQDATGVEVNFHVVQSVTADKTGKTTTGQILSYVSAETKAAGKQAVGAPVFITVSGLPGAKQNVFDFFEAQVVAAKPTDAQDDGMAFNGSRYMFADGVVVADA